MGAAMHGEFAGVSEGVAALAYAAHVRLLSEVSVAVLPQVLQQSKPPSAHLALERLLLRMNQLMSLAREFGLEYLGTVWIGAGKNLFV